MQYRTVGFIIVFQDPSNNQPQPICQECIFGFVVDYDFKSRIQATSLPIPLYSYCKRLDRNRECDEALTTIQIEQNQLFVTENLLEFHPSVLKLALQIKYAFLPDSLYT